MRAGQLGHDQRYLSGENLFRDYRRRAASLACIATSGTTVWGLTGNDRGGDEELLPRLCDERDRQSCIAGCPRRTETGA